MKGTKPGSHRDLQGSLVRAQKAVAAEEEA